MSAFSIVMLGVIPYITASIIMQLMTIIVPKIKEMQQEGGAAGRKKVSNFSRLLSIPLAASQAFGFMTLLKAQGIISEVTNMDIAFGVLIAVTGSVFLMWLGEIISEFGIGNGISLMIFGGIISAIPTSIKTLYASFTMDQAAVYLAVFGAFLAMIYAIVYITEAERPVLVHNAKTAKAGEKVQQISFYYSN